MVDPAILQSFFPLVPTTPDTQLNLSTFLVNIKDSFNPDAHYAAGEDT